MKWRLALVAAVTVACVAWVLWGLDPAAVAAALSLYEVAWLAPVGLFFGLTFVCRVWRFQALLGRPIAFGPMGLVMAISLLAITVMPLRMGELVRPTLLADRHDVPVGEGLAAIVVERVLDLLAMLLLVAVTAWWVAMPGAVEVQGVDVLAVGQRSIGTTAAVGVAGALFVAVAGERALSWLRAALMPISPALCERVLGLLGPFVKGTRDLASRPGALAVAVATTAGVWLLTLGGVAVSMMGMPGMPVSVELVLADWTTTMIGILLVPTPGFIGSFEVASVAALELFGVGRDVATAWSLVMHVLILAFAVLTGLAALALSPVPADTWRRE